MLWRTLIELFCRTGLAALLLAVALTAVAAEESSAPYFAACPSADRFCPPVDGFFDEIQRTVDRVRGHTFRHQPNGGYGLAVVDKVGDAHLLHLGADVGWYRVGDPVFGVANGVVRVSEGPPKVEGDKNKSVTTTDKAPS